MNKMFGSRQKVWVRRKRRALAWPSTVTWSAAPTNYLPRTHLSTTSIHKNNSFDCDQNGTKERVATTSALDDRVCRTTITPFGSSDNPVLWWLLWIRRLALKSDTEKLNSYRWSFVQNFNQSLKYRTTCGLGGRPDPDGAKKHLNIKWVIWVQETLSNIPIREPKNEPPLGRAGP